jgi:hypothetical protein
MVWKYSIGKGLLTDGRRAIKVYAGNGAGKNNVAFAHVRNVGPIPPGVYAIGTAFFHPHAGPVTMRLTPQAGTNTFGRSGFLIHGDSIAKPGTASNGCPVTTYPSGRKDREYIASSPDKTLIVTP